MFKKGSISNIVFWSIASAACIVGGYITGNKLGGAMVDYILKDVIDDIED